MAAAQSVPASLVTFAVREVERAILTGRRSAIGGSDDEAGVVAKSDAAALAALCFPGAAEARPIDRATAEALFDIAHATAAAGNDPAFAEIFARAVGDYFDGAAVADVSATPSGAQWRDVFADFLGRLAGELLADQAAAPSHAADRLAEDRYFEEYRETEARREAAAQIEAGDARWALAHLTRGGSLTAAERRLLARLRAEAGDAPAPARRLVRTGGLSGLEKLAALGVGGDIRDSRPHLGAEPRAEFAKRNARRRPRGVDPPFHRGQPAEPIEKVGDAGDLLHDVVEPLQVADLPGARRGAPGDRLADDVLELDHQLFGAAKLARRASERTCDLFAQADEILAYHRDLPKAQRA